MNQIQSISFHQQQIPVIIHNEKPYVAIKAIAENIGLDWEAQRQRIKRNEILSSVAFMIKAPSKGGVQEAICLPLGYLNGWLAGVELNRVRPEIKPKLKQYQLECFDVLYNHFMPKLAQQHPNTINSEQQYQIKEAVMQLARKTSKRHPAIYHDLYNHFKIPRYQDLLAKDFQAALKFLEWSEPKQITHDENIVLIPFGLLRNATYQVWVRDGKAQKRSIMYAEDAKDIGTPWGSSQ